MDGDILRQYQGKITQQVKKQTYNNQPSKTRALLQFADNVYNFGSAVSDTMMEYDINNFEKILKAEEQKGENDLTYFSTDDAELASNQSKSLELSSKIEALKAEGADKEKINAYLKEKAIIDKKIESRLDENNQKENFNNFESRMNNYIEESLKWTFGKGRKEKEERMNNLVKGYGDKMKIKQQEYIQATKYTGAVGSVRSFLYEGGYSKALKVNQENYEKGYYSSEHKIKLDNEIEVTRDVDFQRSLMKSYTDKGIPLHEAAEKVKEAYKQLGAEHDPGKGLTSSDEWDASVDKLYQKKNAENTRIDQYRSAEAEKITSKGYGNLDEFIADETNVDSWVKAVEIRDNLIQKVKSGEILAKDARGYITAVTAIEKAINEPNKTKVFAEVTEDGLYTSLHARFADGNLTPLDRMKMVEDAKSRLSEADFKKLMTAAGTPDKQYNDIETEYFKVFNSLETNDEKRVFEEQFRGRFENAWDLSKDDATQFKMELGMFDAKNLLSNSEKKVDKRNGEYISPIKSAEYVTDGMLYTDAYKDNVDEHISNTADLITFNDIGGNKVMSAISAGYIVADDETIEELKRTTVGHYAAAGPDGTPYIMLDRGVDAGNNLRIVSLMRVDKDLNDEIVLYPVEKDGERLYFSTIKDELGNEMPQLFRQSVKNGAVTVDESLGLNYFLPGSERKLLQENPIPHMSFEEQEQSMIMNKIFNTKRGNDGTVSYYDVNEAVTENKRYRGREKEEIVEQNLTKQYKNPETVISLLEKGSYSSERMESVFRIAKRYINAHKEFEKTKGGMQVYEIQAHEDMMRNTFPGWNMGTATTIFNMWNKELENKQSKKEPEEDKIITKKKGLDGLTW